MQSESRLGVGFALPTDSEDKEIPSMLEIASQARKMLLRVRKHAETCQCCKEALEKEE